jgi:protein-disulfide isomerase
MPAAIPIRPIQAFRRPLRLRRPPVRQQVRLRQQQRICIDAASRLPEWWGLASRRVLCERVLLDRSPPVIRLRNAFASILALTALIILGGFPRAAMADSAITALLAKPAALPDMAIGPAKAPVTIYEFASMSCPHCAAFEQNVFPMIRSKYVDTGKVRYVFREFPLDVKAAAASMLARCVANGDPEKFFGTIDTMFKQQDPLMTRTLETLQAIGRQSGMDEKATEVCIKDQSLLEKLSADQKFANEQLKVDATPTFFINGTKTKGAISFEEFEAKLKPFLKK